MADSESRPRPPLDFHYLKGKSIEIAEALHRPTSLGQRGPLAGLTLLRFAHAFESGGGTERYLDDLDRALLDRNAMTVLRLHLTRDPSPRGPNEEAAGQGRLVHIPLPIVPRSSSTSAPDEPSRCFRWKQKIRDRVLYHPLVWRSVGARWAGSLRLPRLPGQAIGAGIAFTNATRTRRIDLVMMHFFGGSDADEVVGEARKAGVPIALLNHYSNDRFLHLAIRKHAMLADGVAGVNGLGVPSYLRSRFVNLSDGIDTEFFRRALGRPLANPPRQPIILLPARVVREKGQLDLLRAASSLRSSGIEWCLAFAGRVDASGFIDDLRREIANAGMIENVRFLGDLSVENLRDWYAASAVVAFPTYHHEGLGRVIIEAQAMGTTVVAYASGGVPDGITPGKTGFLIPPGDIDGLTTGLKEILSSPSLRASIGTSGRKAVETRFSLAALAERHERYYTDVIAAFKANHAKVSVR